MSSLKDWNSKQLINLCGNDCRERDTGIHATSQTEMNDERLCSMKCMVKTMKKPRDDALTSEIKCMSKQGKGCNLDDIM